MAKKPVKTFHLLRIAKSLDAQNEAIGFLIAKIISVQDVAGSCTLERLREFVGELAAEAEQVRAVIYPPED